MRLAAAAGPTVSHLKTSEISIAFGRVGRGLPIASFESSQSALELPLAFLSKAMLLRRLSRRTRTDALFLSSL
jgi:hypothetical protein